MKLHCKKTVEFIEESRAKSKNFDIKRKKLQYFNSVGGQAVVLLDVFFPFFSLYALSPVSRNKVCIFMGQKYITTVPENCIGSIQENMSENF